MNNFLKTLIGQPLRDIICIGYSEKQNEWLRFCPLLDTIFLSISDTCLAISSLENQSKVTLRTSKILYSPHKIEEEDVVSSASLLDIVLFDSYSEHKVLKIHLFEIEVTNEDFYVCQAFAVETNLQYLFFDPTHISGLKIGGKDLLDNWQSNNIRDGQKILLKVIEGPSRREE